MIVHLGRRVSALLDGQLSASETERAWQHVHLCHPCRDLVEREGRIKTQLAGLASGRDAAPSYLKGSLLGEIAAMAPAYPDVSPVSAGRSQQRVTLTLIGTSALGLAMLGALALTVPLAQPAPGERRLPVSDLSATSAPQPEPATSSPAGGPTIVQTTGRANPLSVARVSVQNAPGGYPFAPLTAHRVK